ncbi:Vitamin B12-binding protein [Microbacterium oleivorans]|uniref:ABC transporter substrate-binding protein n=1 Tax=Microbacterium oleivorans TaxID=273677 RepID=UPI000976C0C8|nr:ABC transporter substrate-binding protein [Microbacterium oleivorans]AZS44966.1 Vitamin B12-binding protein [Microbacterium oleivorans]
MPFPRRSALLATFTALALALSGCGASEVVTEKAAATGERSTNYPVTIQNCGRTVEVDEAPQRVVSLDQNSTEILLSLGLADRIVGTASWTDPVLPSLADENAKVPRLADNAPTYEVLLGADPDFVTASFGRHYAEGGVVTRDRLAETGIGSYLSPTDCADDRSVNAGGTRTTALTVDDLYTEIRELATVFDVPSRGDALIASLEKRAAAAVEGVDFGGQKVVFWFADTRTPYMAGGRGAAAILADKTGMTGAFADQTDDWPAVSWEAVVDADPDVIVLGDLQRDRFPGDRLDDKIAFLENDPVTRVLTTVKEKRFIALHGAEMNPSIRFIDGLEKIRTWWDENEAGR